MRWSRRLGVGALGLVLSCTAALGAAAEARADDAATAKVEAREAARRASDSFRAGRHAEALELLGHAESLVHAPTHVLMMARSHAALGKLVRARRAYQEVVAEALPAGSPAAFERAKKEAAQELAALDAKLPRITVTVTPKDAARLAVKQDGEPIPPAELSAPRPIDPGTHTFTASAEGLSAQPVTVSLAEGARETIELALQPAAAAAVVPVATPRPTAAPRPAAKPAAAPRQEPPDSMLRAPGWGALALGAAGVAVGAALMPAANSKALEAKNLRAGCGAACTDGQLAEADRIERNGSSLGTASAIGLAGGGVLVVGGLALLVAAAYGEEAAERTPPPKGVAIRPVLGLATLGARGSF
jgi:hypothetical protein